MAMEPAFELSLEARLQPANSQNTEMYPETTAAPSGDGEAFREPIKVSTLDEAERDHILRALEATGWRIEGPRGAFAMLKIHPSTLRFCIKKRGLTKVLSYKRKPTNRVYQGSWNTGVME